MKTRRLLAALALVLFGLFALAGTASGQEPEVEAENEAENEAEVSHEAELCIAELEAGGEPAGCFDAPSPILPATNELIWGGITFTVLLLAMAKFGLPAVRNMMDERTQRIRGDLDAAETAKTEAVGIREEYSRQLADAKAESGRIIEEARQAADAVRRDLIARAETEAAELRQRNAEQLDAERARIMAELRGQVATLAIELAEKVVESNLDRDTNTRLIESYIQQVGQK